jgi:hypothetical protein
MCLSLQIPHQGFGRLDAAAKLLGMSANTREENRAKRELVIIYLSYSFQINRASQATSGQCFTTFADVLNKKKILIGQNWHRNDERFLNDTNNHLFSVHIPQSPCLRIHGLIEIPFQLPHSALTGTLVCRNGLHELSSDQSAAVSYELQEMKKLS